MNYSPQRHIYGFLLISFLLISQFFSQDLCERDMRHVNEIIICRERGKLKWWWKKTKGVQQREGTQQQNMNMKEAFLCPLCLLCCVINLQILLPSKSRHKPFCNKGKVTRHVCFLCISFAWPSGIEPRSLALFNLTYSLFRSPLP